MSKYLYEWDTGWKFGPAGDNHVAQFETAKANGKPYFDYPYHGYHLRMEVRDDDQIPRAKVQR